MQAGRRYLDILRLHRRFAGNRKGAVAVEFALVAFPLVFMLLACFELAMIIVLSVTLDHATDVTARQIRTGILTQSNSTASSFAQKVCDNMGWLAATCPSSLHIDVQTYDSFAQVPTTDLIKNGQFDTANFAYNIGAGSKIQLVRAYFEWPLFTPLLQAGLSTLGNKDAVISSKVVFRNEPF